MFLEAQGATFAWYQFISYGGGGAHDFKANWLWTLKSRYKNKQTKKTPKKTNQDTKMGWKNKSFICLYWKLQFE